MGSTAGVTAANQAPVDLVVIRVGGPHDRIHDPDGGVESTYQPDLRAPQLVGTLVNDAHGYAFAASQTGSAATQLRKLFGSGPTKTEGVSPTTVALAPYLVALACLGLVGVLWKRNARSL